MVAGSDPGAGEISHTRGAAARSPISVILTAQWAEGGLGVFRRVKYC